MIGPNSLEVDMSDQRYRVCYCSECKIDFSFQVKKNHTNKKPNCPICADNTEVVIDRDTWIQKPYINKNKTWTEDEDATLVYGFEKKGLTSVEVSKLLHMRTPSACRKRYYYMTQKQNNK